MINRPSTSKGEEIFEGQAESTLRSQISSSKSLNTKSSNTSSSETDSESDQEELKDSERWKPQSAAALAKEAKLKGQKFLKEQYKKFNLILLTKPKNKPSNKRRKNYHEIGQSYKKI